MILLGPRLPPGYGIGLGAGSVARALDAGLQYNPFRVVLVNATSSRAQGGAGAVGEEKAKECVSPDRP